jgi:hypothetical protein
LAAPARRDLRLLQEIGSFKYHGITVPLLPGAQSDIFGGVGFASGALPSARAAGTLDDSSPSTSSKSSNLPHP